MPAIDQTAAAWLLGRCGKSATLEGEDRFARLVGTLCPDDVAMRHMVRIVRGADAPEQFDVMPESAGLRSLIAGWAAISPSNESAPNASAVFEALHAELRSRALRGEPFEIDPLVDPVSGLPTRLLFLDRLAQAIAYAHRHDTHVAVCSVRIELGELAPHMARVVREIADRLQHTIRELDTAARLGLDEFGIVLNDLRHRESAEIAAQKVAEILSEPFDVAGLCRTIEPRIGISFYPAHGHDAWMLLDAARAAVTVAAPLHTFAGV